MSHVDPITDPPAGAQADPAPSPLVVPARTIPVPKSVSPQAQAVLARGRIDTPPWPPLDDPEAWRSLIAATDQAVTQLVGAVDTDSYRTEEITADGVRIFAITPPGTDPADHRVYLDIHGGALISGGGDNCRLLGTHIAARLGVPVWTPDYRMPPDHPYPAALDDCVAAYRAVLRDHRPEEVVVGGGSAGGNLAAALILRARDEGLPLPAAAVLLTPELDLTESGDTFHTLDSVDTVLGRSLMPVNLLYADGHDLAHPYVSPLFGDFTAGFPPTLLSSGTRDRFLSNAVRMHRALRAAGVPAELHVLEAAPHGGFMADTPEERDLNREVRRFIDRHWVQRDGVQRDGSDGRTETAGWAPAPAEPATHAGEPHQMPANDAPPGLSVPERVIPVPTSVSSAAQRMLAAGLIGPLPEWLDADLDAAGWKELIAAREAAVLALSGTGAVPAGTVITTEDFGGFDVFMIRPPGVPSDDRRVYLEFHGGGFIQDGGRIACSRAVDTARSLGVHVWSVDYRMPPDHPFPTGVDDGVAAYRRLLEQRSPAEIIVGGPSAGGNLAVAVILKARDAGLPLPAACLVHSPCTDLTESGDTWLTNEGVDTVMRGSYLPCFRLYAHGHDLRDPYLSPVYADFTKGFPPTILTTGTRDKLLSDTVRLHRALRQAGIAADLHVWEAYGHAGFLGTAPEDGQRADEVRRFAELHWSA